MHDSLQFFSELALIQKNRKYIKRMEEDIFEVLLNSCYESISFYASICLYRTNPRNSKSGFFVKTST